MGLAVNVLALLVVGYFVGVVLAAISLGRDKEMLEQVQRMLPIPGHWAGPAALFIVALTWPILVPAVLRDLRGWWRARRALRHADKVIKRFERRDR